MGSRFHLLYILLKDFILPIIGLVLANLRNYFSLAALSTNQHCSKNYKDNKGRHVLTYKLKI